MRLPASSDIDSDTDENEGDSDPDSGHYHPIDRNRFNTGADTDSDD